MASGRNMNTNQTGNTDFCYEFERGSCPKFIYSQIIRIPLYIFFISVIFLTVCGNLLVIISIVHFKNLQTPTNYLILSLSIADFLLGVLIMPASMVRTIESCWYFGDTFCKIHLSVDIVLCTVSITSLSFISIDRYYAVCKPLHYHTKITTCTRVIMIVMSWTVSACFGFAIIYLELHHVGIEDFYNSNNNNNVVCVGGCTLVMNWASGTSTSFLSFYLPGFIMLAIYMKIFYIAQKQVSSINSIACKSENSENKASKRERKATKTLAIIMGVFLSCWMPFFVCNTIDPFVNYSLPPLLVDTFIWIGYFNSTCNPIVYALFYKWFRKAFKMIIFGKILKAHSSGIKLS